MPSRCRSCASRRTTTSRRGCCTRSRKAGAAISRRRARSTGAATSSAWPGCSGATCPSSTTLPSSGWTTQRHLRASEFVQHLLDLHSAPMAAHWPHRELIAFTTERLRDPELAAALEAGTSFDPERTTPLAVVATPATRLADPAPAPEPVEATMAATAASTPGRPPSAERRRCDQIGRVGAAARRRAGARGGRAGRGRGENRSAADLAQRAAKRRARRLAQRAGFASPSSAPRSPLWWFGGEQRNALRDAVARRSQPIVRRRRRRRREHRRSAASRPRRRRPGPTRRRSRTRRCDRGGERRARGAHRNVAARASARRRRRCRAPARARAGGRGASAEFRRRSDVRAAARAMRSATPPAPPPTTAQGALARVAQRRGAVAYGRSNDVADAIALQTKAFGANPFDSEVAGNLAFLLLKQQPPADRGGAPVRAARADPQRPALSERADRGLDDARDRQRPDRP